MGVPVDGGPADGLVVGRGGTLRWIDVHRGRGFRRPAPGRTLYRLRAGRYEFVRGRVCTICGALVVDWPPAVWCHLCGGETKRPGG